MPVILPTKERVKQINIYVIQNSTDPNEDTSDAGKFFNERYLDDALNPCFEYQTVFEAAYGLAYAIAGLNVFFNGNKRTATRTVIETCNGNSLNFNGDNTALVKLVNSLVKTNKNDANDDDDDDEKLKNDFITGISELFT